MSQKPADKEQQKRQEAKKQSDQHGSYGEQGNDIAQKANMKRQQKQMHKQDGKK